MRAAVAILALSLAGGCRKSAPACAERTLAGVRAAAPPTIDGKLEEPAWLEARPSQPFVDGDQPAAVVPHSEARVLWDDAALYVGFYAADEDIRAGDYVGVTIRAGGKTFGWELSPTGKLACHQDCAGVHAAADTDGTVDVPGDDDEEWTGELAIPWSGVGLSRAPADLQVNFFRRDQAKGGPLRQLMWTRVCPATPPLGLLKLH